MITSLLAQALEPIRIISGPETPAPDRTLWVLIASFAGAALIMLAAFLLVKRARNVETDPERLAWNKIVSDLGLRARQRRTLERLAELSEIKPCALALSRGAMERAVLLCVQQFQRSELQAACGAIWPDLEVPGAAGNLPTVRMPEIRAPRQLTAPSAKPRSAGNLRATA